MWTASLVRGFSLSEDSTRFARYWSLVEAGDSLGAATLLIGGAAGEPDFEKLANFVLAWRAYEAGDDSSVPVYLGLGVPTVLEDHAARMRASALERAGQANLAAVHWTDLARNEETIFRAEALQRLAELNRAEGNLDSLFVLVSEHSRVSSDRKAIQHLELITAEVMTDLQRHEEAVERLWIVYLTDPKSEDGARAAYLLDRYETEHRFRARGETPPEFELELDRLLNAGQHSFGLERVRERKALPEYARMQDALLYYEGRFLSGKRHFRDALEILQRHVTIYSISPFREQALFHLARAAYLRDRDELAVSTIEQLNRDFPNSVAAADGLKLLGTLYLDRGRAEDAALAFERWHKNVLGTSDATEALWKIGRSWWDAERYSNASKYFVELAEFGPGSDYHPVALYWAARAATLARDQVLADSLIMSLHSRYPYSYYTILSQPAIEIEVETRDLLGIPLDTLWALGGNHTKKFALLTAARLPKQALLEWEGASRECGSAPGLTWWKAQLNHWAGNRLAAWRVVRSSLGGFISTAGERPFDFYRIVYPLDFDPRIIRLAEQYQLDPYFLFALICQESHFEETIVSGAGAIGLMQLMPETAKRQARKIGKRISTSDLYSADINLEIGVAHVAELWKEFSGDSVLVLAAYNAGRSVAQAWFEEFGDRDRDVFIENIPYRETRLFVKNIIEHAAAYRRLYPDVLSVIRPEQTPDN